MKKVLLLSVLFLILFTVQARADFFDDSNGAWWMAPDQWEIYDEPQNSFLSSHDSASGLAFSAESVSPGAEDTLGYVSRWTIDLNHDFNLDIRMNYNYSSYNSDNGLRLGLSFVSSDWDPSSGSMDSLEYEYNKSLDTEITYIYIMGTQIPVLKYGVTSLTHSAAGDTESFLSNSAPYAPLGFNIDYDADSDTMYFDYLGMGASGVPESVLSGARETFFGEDQTKLMISAWTMGEDFSYGQLRVERMTLNAVMAPEPVSSVLFCLGGIVLGVLRRRKFRIGAIAA